MSRVLHVFTGDWATGDHVACLFHTQLMFLKNRKRTRHKKKFDDDERIRSLTEAEAITSEITGGK